MPLRAILLLMAMVGVQPAIAKCELLAPTGYRAGASHDMTVDDLVRIRDIGQGDGSLIDQPSPLALSPDGKHLAFQMRRADPDSNNYCIGLVLVNVDGKPEPRLLDQGGDLIIATTVMRRMRIAVGAAAPIAPRWSPDGRSIAYLRRDRGITQVWLANVDGSGSAPLTRLSSDIEGFAWTRDSRRIIVATRPDLHQALAAIDQEGLAGWRYDARTAPYLGNRPQAAGDLPLAFESVDRISGAVSPAGADERALVRDVDGDAPMPDILSVRGERAWTASRGDGLFSPQILHVADRAREEIACPWVACSGGLVGLWWARVGKELRFLRREGWANDRMALYRWTPGHGAPKVVLRTSDVLIGCIARDDDLLCMREGSVQPPHIVAIKGATGRTRTVFDPNPEFATIRFGAVERLRWRNARGQPVRGDLVVPPGYKRGMRLPLVIVQYHSDGFLRGGTGDEYPIPLFAARGFAVLSFERPADVATLLPGVKDWKAFQTANAKDWADRRNVLSSLLVGVDRLVARGIVDPKRIGLTGLSDGASTVRFALINSDRFAAASVSSCCADLRSAMIYAGEGFAQDQKAMGMPLITQDDRLFWRPYSLALNASTMNRPLLMQLADEEYLLALESYSALREQKAPTDLYVFPGEHHFKWQPAHRHAIYARNLDWFSFWLQGVQDPDPAKTAQYLHWIALREQRDGRSRP